MLMSGIAGHIDSWLAIARHEKSDQLEKSNGYNSCDAQLSYMYSWGHMKQTLCLDMELCSFDNTGLPRNMRGIIST